MSKRAAVLAADIEVGMLVWVAHATPASVLVNEVKKSKRQTYIRRAGTQRWIVLEADKTYPLIKERT